MNAKLSVKFFLTFILVMSAAAPVFAGKESEKALQEYEDEVKKIYDQPVNQAEDLLFDTYLLKESEGPTDFVKVSREQESKSFKPLKEIKDES